MNILRIEDKCDNCMRCVRDCAAGVWRDVNGVPTPVVSIACNLCSHCLAVCPKGAIEHDKLDPEQVRRAKKKLLDDEAYREIVRTRRSVRHFKKKEIPREVIENIIDLARYSPTASNSQNVGYIVVTDKELLRKISKRIFGYGLKVDAFIKSRHGKLLLKALEKTEMAQTFGRYTATLDYYKSETAKGRDYILHNAPVLILLHGPKGSFSCDNCNIAATNITNYAHSLGLGTCFIGFITETLRFIPTLRKWLQVPKGRRVYAALVMGYPTYSHTFTVSRKEPDVGWIEGNTD